MSTATNAWLTLDVISKRYGILPTEQLARGSTIDVFVANLGMQYENWLSKKHDKGQSAPEKSQDELQGMLDRAKNKRKQ